MKFKFRVSKRKTSLLKYKKLILRGRNTLCAVKSTKLVPISSKMVVANKKSTPKSSGVLALTKAFLKIVAKCFSFLGRIKLPPLKAVFVFFVCTFSVALVSGILVVGSLFFRYRGNYTDVTVPSFTSLTEEEAIALYPEVFDYEIIYKENLSAKQNTVTAQIPAEGVVRKFYGKDKKIKITLTVNSAKTFFTIPSLYNTSLRDALILLKSNGINVRILKEHSENIISGNIISCSLPEGTKIIKGDTLTIRASIGKKEQLIDVPNILGLSENEAIELLKSLGLALGKIDYVASKSPAGSVISQAIAPDMSLTKGTKISFTVSGGLYY